jgi:tRNA(fMet)-specific endonuclease VapC
MILDTSFVIDFFRGQKDAVQKAQELDRTGEPLFITSVTFFELWQGLDAKIADKKKKLENFADAFGMFPLDMESAKRGGEIHSDLRSRGAQIDPEDSMISGIAIKNSQTLLTRDTHFARIKGLRVEAY